MERGRKTVALTARAPGVGAPMDGRGAMGRRWDCRFGGNYQGSSWYDWEDECMGLTAK